MSLQEKVFALLKKIPKGRVTSYKEMARKLGTSPRAVGKALSANPHPIKIPCHRVVHADGRIGGYKLGVKKKISLLKEEGINIKSGRIENLRFYRL